MALSLKEVLKGKSAQNSSICIQFIVFLRADKVLLWALRTVNHLFSYAVTPKGVSRSHATTFLTTGLNEWNAIKRHHNYPGIKVSAVRTTGKIIFKRLVLRVVKGNSWPVIPGGHTQKKELSPSIQRPSLQGFGLQSSMSTSHLFPVNPSGQTHTYSPLPAARLTLATHEAPFRHSQERTNTWRGKGKGFLAFRHLNFSHTGLWS